MLGASASGGFTLRLRGNGGSIQIQGHSAFSIVVTSYAAGTSLHRPYCFTYSSTGTNETRANAASLLEGSNSSRLLDAGRTTSIGRQSAGNYWNGPIAAVLVRTVVLNVALVARVGSALMTKHFA